MERRLLLATAAGRWIVVRGVNDWVSAKRTGRRRSSLMVGRWEATMMDKRTMPGKLSSR